MELRGFTNIDRLINLDITDVTDGVFGPDQVQTVLTAVKAKTDGVVGTLGYHSLTESEIEGGLSRHASHLR